MASQLGFRERKGYPTKSIVLGALTAVFTIILKDIRQDPDNNTQPAPGVLESALLSNLPPPIVVHGPANFEHGSSESSCPLAFALDIMKRTEFGYTGCTVYGWPSSGCILIKEPADVVDLKFLDINRLKASSRSDNIIEEDAFCNCMRQIGAKWWENEKEFVDVSIGMRGATELESRELVFGWPTSGGIWGLRFDHRKKLPRDFGRIHRVLVMDERCQVIKEYGGTFYEDPKDVMGLAQLSQPSDPFAIPMSHSIPDRPHETSNLTLFHHEYASRRTHSAAAGQ